MRAALVAFLALAGCRSQLLDDTDGGTLLDFAVRVDGGGARRDAAGCSTHEFVPVPLTSIVFVDLPQALWHGAAVRVAVEHPWRPACDVLGPVEVVVTPGNATDGVAVTAHLWRSSASCGPTATARRIVVLSDRGMLDNPSLVVRDGAPGGAARAQTGVGQKPPGATCAAVMLGADCLLDCQCEATLAAARCVPAGDLFQTGVCFVSCSEDADCTDGVPVCNDTVALGVCLGSAGSCSIGGTDCPFGQSCQSVGASHACRTPLIQHSPGGSCVCDEDCAAGALCVSGGDAPGACVFPCATTADCPGRPGCGALECMPEGVCVPNTC
jgi:hypothetical protein